MSPQERAEWIEKATLQELVDSAIWSAVMEGTAWCGWTDRAREGLVKQVQESVKWAIDKKLTKEASDE